MSEELKPCPFCAGEARIVQAGTSRYSTLYVCDDCGCSLETGEETNHGRIWNDRPYFDELAALRAQVAAITLDVASWKESYCIANNLQNAANARADSLASALGKAREALGRVEIEGHRHYDTYAKCCEALAAIDAALGEKGGV